MDDVTDRSAELMDRIAGTDDLYAILDVPRDAFVLEVSSEEHTNIELVLRLICLQAEHMLRARAAGRANPLGVAVDVVGSASLDASLESARERVRAHEMLLLQTPRPTASGAGNAGAEMSSLRQKTSTECTIPTTATIST